MKKRIAISLGVVTAVLAAGAWSPAAAQNKREMQMMADIRMLQEQNQQLQVLLAQLNDALNGSLKTLNGRLDDQANVNRKAFADQNLKIDQFASDLRVVREGVSENNVRISSLSQEMEALRLSIPQYPRGTAAAPPSTDPNAAPTAGGAPTGTSAAPAAPAPSAPAASPGIGMSPQRVYDTAWADYTSGQWDLCISGFDMYLRTFPRSDLADEAQFYIGECHYADGKNQEAVQAYNAGDHELPARSVGRAGVLQARSGVRTARTGGSRARIVRSGGQILSRQRRRTPRETESRSIESGPAASLKGRKAERKEKTVPQRPYRAAGSAALLSGEGPTSPGSHLDDLLFLPCSSTVVR